MVEKKHYKLLGILALLVLANIINAFIGKETTLEYKMQDAMESHEHENAVIFASNLLQQEPTNQDAIKIIKSSGQILFYLQQAQTKIPEFRVAENKQTGQMFFYVNSPQVTQMDAEANVDNVIVKPEKVYEEFKLARAYAEKARQLDAGFKTTQKFEKKLDEAQSYVLNVLAANAFDAGKQVYAAASSNYQKKASLIDAADDSAYLDKFLAVQSAWAAMETPVAEIKHKINPLLEKMDNYQSIACWL